MKLLRLWSTHALLSHMKVAKNTNDVVLLAQQMCWSARRQHMVLELFVIEAMQCIGPCLFGLKAFEPNSKTNLNELSFQFVVVCDASHWECGSTLAQIFIALLLKLLQGHIYIACL